VYVPGATRTLSPAEAASTPAWIVGYSLGTRRAVAVASAAASRNKTATPSPTRWRSLAITLSGSFPYLTRITFSVFTKPVPRIRTKYTPEAGR
jgi:hypothetical protein